MDWESADMFRLDLRPLIQGQASVVKLKSAYDLLIIAPRFLEYEANL